MVKDSNKKTIINEQIGRSRHSDTGCAKASAARTLLMILDDKIAERRLTCFGRVSGMGSERLSAKVLHCSVNGRRQQGGNRRSG